MVRGSRSGGSPDRGFAARQGRNIHTVNTNDNNETTSTSKIEEVKEGNSTTAPPEQVVKTGITNWSEEKKAELSAYLKGQGF